MSSSGSSSLCSHNHVRHAIYLFLLAIVALCKASSSSSSSPSIPQKASPQKSAALPHEFACLQADRPIDIVLSHSKENLNTVRSKLLFLQSHPFIANNGCVHLYTKSGNSISTSASLLDLDANENGLNVSVVVKTHNVGRESGAYLHYILANYHNLPRHVIFLQADVESIERVLDTLNQATEQTGFLGLGLWDRCDCDYCLFPGRLVRLREVWALATGTLCLHEFRANFRGQMLVSRERIHRHRPDFYLFLLRSLFAQPGHVLHEDAMYIDDSLYSQAIRRAVDAEGAHDSLFGHVMERVWSVIFDCYREEEATAVGNCLD